MSLSKENTVEGELPISCCTPACTPAAVPQPTHLLHFEPLTAGDAGLDIPCDPCGRVWLDALGDKLRNDYFFARTLIGRLFARPTVRARPALAARG